MLVHVLTFLPLLLTSADFVLTIIPLLPLKRTDREITLRQTHKRSLSLSGVTYKLWILNIKQPSRSKKERENRETKQNHKKYLHKKETLIVYHNIQTIQFPNSSLPFLKYPTVLGYAWLSHWVAPWCCKQLLMLNVCNHIPCTRITSCMFTLLYTFTAATKLKLNW